MCQSGMSLGLHIKLGHKLLERKFLLIFTTKHQAEEMGGGRSE